MAQTELGVRTSAVARLAAVMKEASEEFVRDLANPEGLSSGVAALSPEGLQREALGAVRVLERAQVQVEAAMHLAAGVALSVEAEEQERLLDLPLDEKIGRNKGRRGSGRGKHQDAFTVTPPTNANSRAGSGPVTGCGVGSVDPWATTDATTASTARDAGTTNPTGTDSSSTSNASTGADSSSAAAGPASSAGTGFARGSAFFPGFDSRDVSDSEVVFPRVWCGVSVKAMDEALWGLGSELALLWGRSEFVTTGMLIDTATLSRLPNLEARFITGLLNSRLVKTAVKHCVGLTDEQAVSYDTRLHEFMFPAKYDVTGQYPVRSANDVAKFAEVTRNRLHAEPLAVRERREMKHRYVSISNESNGMCTISGLLPAIAAHRFMNTLTDFAITAKTENDTRTLKQLIADVFTDLITHNYNHSYPNTPPRPASSNASGSEGTSAPDPMPEGTETASTDTTGTPPVGADHDASHGADGNAGGGGGGVTPEAKQPGSSGAKGTSAPETGSGPTAGTDSRLPGDQEPADTGPGGSAPTEKLSYDSIHDLFDHTTTPRTGVQGTTTPKDRATAGFEGTTAPDDRAGGTSAPLSGNGSAPGNDWEREECYWVDADGVIHDHPTNPGDASAHPDTGTGASESQAGRSAGGVEPETAPHTGSHPGTGPESDPDSGVGADADPGAGFTGDFGASEDAGSVPENGVGSRSGLRGEAKIFVTIPATSLAGLDEQDGMLSGYGPIPADAIRELAGTAHTLYRMFVDPDTGRPLALGRSSYRVDTQLREFLQLRSDTCQFPGCGVNARRTDADHITEWDTGGETNPENLQLLCRKHHNLKTHHGWQAKVLDPESGTIQWTSPLGNVYLAEPVGTGTGTATGTETDAGTDAGTGTGAGSRSGDSPDVDYRSGMRRGNRSDAGSRDPWGMPPRRERHHCLHRRPLLEVAHSSSTPKPRDPRGRAGNTPSNFSEACEYQGS